MNYAPPHLHDRADVAPLYPAALHVLLALAECCEGEEREARLAIIARDHGVAG